MESLFFGLSKDVQDESWGFQEICYNLLVIFIFSIASSTHSTKKD